MLRVNFDWHHFPELFNNIGALPIFEPTTIGQFTKDNIGDRVPH